MNTKSLPNLVWLFPAALLMMAVARLPYGYYTFMRIVVRGSAVVIAVVVFKDRSVFPVWPIPIVVVIAVLFDPLLPLQLARGTWFYLDLGAAIAFVAHLLMARREPTPKETQ